ncbi:MAG: hypothetical protein AAF596_00405 [Planctomycetota bacterium]
MATPHIFVLAVDGLRASSLGAYGGAGTPAIDRFASGSTLHEWFFADSPELASVYEAIWGRDGRHLSDFLSGSKRQSVLLTDDPAVEAMPAAGSFAATKTIAAVDPPEPADGIAEAWLATTVAEFAAILDSCHTQTRDGEGLFAWMHTRGFYGPWDAPSSTVVELLDEDDSPIEPSVVPPAIPAADNDPDAAFHSACRYAAQASVLDACVAQFVECIDDAFGDEPRVLAILGTRGYALGEHVVIGHDDRLYAESLHVPLLIRRSDGLGALLRSSTPIGGSAVLRALSGKVDHPEQGRPLQQSSASGARAVHQQDWRLIVPPQTAVGHDDSGPELYLKPDDRWEVNNVATLMPEVARGMLSLLSAGGERGSPLER